MAARNHKVLKQTFRFFSPKGKEGLAGLPADEFDESDVWCCQAESRSAEFRQPVPRSRASWKKAETSASLPVNIPDWSKILLQEHKSSSNCCINRRIEEEEEEEQAAAVIPPHEMVLSKRVASLSVVEGVGRTLKGRDLSRVRNSIWAKTGFQD